MASTNSVFIAVVLALAVPFVISQQFGGGSSGGGDATFMAPLASAFGMVGMDGGFGGPPNKSALLLTLDPCVYRCQAVGLQLPSQPDPTELNSILIAQYCEHADCLRKLRPDNSAGTCLDRVFSPHLRGMCELAEAERRQCTDKLRDCQRAEMQTMTKISSVAGAMGGPPPGYPPDGGFGAPPGGSMGYPPDGAPPGGSMAYPPDGGFGPPPGPPQSMEEQMSKQISAVLSMQTVVMNSLCDDYQCLQDTANTCGVRTKHLQAVSMGILKMFANNPKAEMPESMYCCLPDLYHAQIGTCLPESLDHILGNRDALEPIFGGKLLSVVSDNMRNIKAILSQWTKDTASNPDKRQRWADDLAGVIKRFMDAMQQENISPEKIMERLQQPELVKPMMRVACDNMVNQLSCTLQATKGTERCDDYWSHMKKSLVEVKQKLAEAKKMSEGQPHAQGALKAVEMFLEECPMDGVAARVEKATGHTSAAPVPTATALHLLFVTVSSTLLITAL